METGLAFAGGGVPGSAAVGVLMALEEAGITVTHITGTSSGAMVAALYAYGYTPEDLTKIVPMLNRKYLDVDWRAILYKALFLRPRLEGWMKGDRFSHLIRELTCNDPLSALRIPCGIVASDLRQGKPIVFTAQELEPFESIRKASIAEAVRASISIPVLFQPVFHGDYMLIDGGVTTNCPVRVCRALGAKRVIAVDPVTPIAGAIAQPSNIYQVLHKVIHLNLKLQMEAEHEHADLVLSPETGPVGPFDFFKVGRSIKAGYLAATSQMDRIMKLVQD
jgi:NTE family protein